MSGIYPYKTEAEIINELRARNSELRKMLWLLVKRLPNDETVISNRDLGLFDTNNELVIEDTTTGCTRLSARKLEHPNRAWCDARNHVVVKYGNSEHGYDTNCAEDLLKQLQAAIALSKAV